MERLAGVVKSVTFRNNSSGYTVVRVVAEGRPVVAVGILPNLAAGERVELEGEWTEHPKYGRQLQAKACRLCTPDSGEALVRYLASGSFPGVGQKTAEALCREFGSELPTVIEREPHRLLGVARGFGPAKIQLFLGAWRAASDEREVMLFLFGNGVPDTAAKEAWKAYGKGALPLLKANPYILCEERFGLTFAKADIIAGRLGIKGTAAERLEAGLLCTLIEASLEGHLFLPPEILFDKTFDLLGLNPTDDDSFDEMRSALGKMLDRNSLAEFGGGVWLPRLLEAEQGIADFVRRKTAAGERKLPDNAADELAKFEFWQGIKFEERQRESIFLAFRKAFAVLTGGPGTGKTTILRGVMRLAEANGERVVLAAPTGRAAKRMNEICGGEMSSTIHRLLCVDPETGKFGKNAQNPILADVLIVDEFSMVDAELCYALFSAVPKNCRVLLIGDADQLPSIGPGDVLRELLKAPCVPSVRLERIFRQKGENDIAEYAGKLNRGLLPAPLEGRNFHFVPFEGDAEGLSALFATISDSVPRLMQLDKMRDLQILVPMHLGTFGTFELNKKLQALLNPGGVPGKIANVEWRTGDRVMQLKNNYEKNIFNGDIGFVTNVGSHDSSLEIDFDGRVLKFAHEELEDLCLAYAITVHKAQGSEYPAVVIVLDSSHKKMLKRNLVYTAVTRAKGHVWVLSAPGALNEAVRNFRETRRYTLLSEMLSGSEPLVGRS